MQAPSPNEAIHQLASGFLAPRCLHIVAELGVADALDETPKTAAALASATKANPDALARMLRLLASVGVFEMRGDTFAHTPMSRLLRSDHPQSARAFARMLGSHTHWSAFGELEYTARTGASGMTKVAPEGVFAYFAKHPEAGKIFNEAMTAKSHGEIAALIPAYDFKAFKTIGDIGGGRGHLLNAVLASAPSAKGVLFDLPQVVADAKGVASERLKLQSGDFFKDALPVCDAYLVMNVIHDWADPEALTILSAIRKAAPAHAKLLLIESLIPETPGPHLAKSLDIVMLSLTGGRERTQSEYQALLADARFRLERVVPTQGPASIIEAVPK